MKSVVFCSSQRFKKELADFIVELRAHAGKRGLHLVIFDPEFEDRPDDLHLASEKDRLADPQYRNSVAGRVYDHLFRKVRVADVCFIFNKDGYLGANTNGELFAAAALGKTIYALHEKTMMGAYPHDLYEEPSSRKLIHEVVSDPDALLKRLS
ncbi:MAG: hypothetical protein A2128_02365 [Candidatus Liptonbacteria bacterium GWC1_60_9]|uniref:CD-NTase-associated protein 12/Pycsar effector protein TIR domain-containing protein n=2 Tax=Candidatus Liptoniibacteriota TaxID=1817909 RepID=A0A1G2CL37_9BACT|nr:MAG: hypothetical protein A2128_02365 [Candidatus Liptonbacteria bacterium GWC1_60_9]OGZ01967.1 MAG: hypothetical protein A3G64_01745 [Candidatus Liptonbacteria bacterium RIFCSPLOWO2_12_FULL_60_15]